MIPTSETLTRAKAIIDNIETLQAELAALFGSSAAAPAPAPAKRRGRPPGPAKTALFAPVGKKKRNMSPEGRARIAAAAKARWAKFNAAKKKASKD